MCTTTETYWKSLGCVVSATINQNYIRKNKKCSFLLFSIANHGTHVASIAAGNHKTTSGLEELDGVAPGAKIVSLTIGDGRLGSVVLFRIISFFKRCNKCLSLLHVIHIDRWKPEPQLSEL